MSAMLRIGSRGSKLAVAQAEWVAAELKKTSPELKIEFKRISTTGDRDANSALTAIGGKGVFVKEIEDALLSNDIDLAIHSLKDMPQSLPSGLCLGPYPKREVSADALISRFGEQLHELPRGSTIGTSSPRRQAQIAYRFKKRGYRLVPLRGNVETRLKKLTEGHYDAIVLAQAGLKRLGLDGEITQILPDDVLLPAPGQGCLGLELREDDEKTLKIITTIKDSSSDITARAERAFLAAIGGDCMVPLAAQATIVGAEIKMRALLVHPSGAKAVESLQTGEIHQPEYVGARLAERLLMEGGAELLRQIEHTPS